MKQLESLKALVGARKKATSGRWKKDMKENIGHNWLISHGFGADRDGTIPILTTDNVRASAVDCGEASADVSFIAIAANWATDEAPALIARFEKMREALKWIVDNECAHPAIVIAVAKEALED